MIEKEYEVVYTGKPEMNYRYVLPSEQCEKINDYQIKLPDNFYSRGMCERVWNVEWKELPWLKELPELTFKE